MSASQPMSATKAQRLANELAAQIKAAPPKVRVVRLGRAGWSGRYFPKSGTVMVRFGRRRCAGKRCDPDMKRELLAHELAHWATRVRFCGETRVRARKSLADQRAEKSLIQYAKRAFKKQTGRAMTKREQRTLKKQLAQKFAPRRARTCKSYRGEHNEKFYNVLDGVQKFFGNSRFKARTLESRAGYKPPPDYQR